MSFSDVNRFYHVPQALVHLTCDVQTVSHGIVRIVTGLSDLAVKVLKTNLTPKQTIAMLWLHKAVIYTAYQLPMKTLNF